MLGPGSSGGSAGLGGEDLPLVLEGRRRAWGTEAERSSQQPASLPESAESDHNLSVPLSLQPQLPPDLSKQGKELQHGNHLLWQGQTAARVQQGPEPDPGWEREPRGWRDWAPAVFHAHLRSHRQPPNTQIVGVSMGLSQARAQLQGTVPESQLLM